MADRDVRKLAAALCDGEAIDWGGLQQPGDPATGKSVRGLAALQELFGEQCARQPATPTRNIPLGSACLMILAATQCAAAVVGYLLERGEGAPGPEVLPLAVIVTLAITAFALLAFGRRDRRVVSLAAFFLVVASAPAQRLMGPLRDLVPARLAILTTGIFPDSFIPFFLWRFARDFPRTFRFSPVDRLCENAARVSAAIGVLLFGANAVMSLTFGTPVPSGLAALRRSSNAYWVIEFLLVVPALLMLPARARIASAAEKRRVRFFLSGLALGVLPIVVQVLLEALFPAYDRFANSDAHGDMTDAVLYAFLLTIPLTTSYSVIVHHVLELRAIAQVAVRYLLARYTLALMTATPFFVVALQLYGQRHRSIADLLGGGRGAPLAATAALGFILLTVRVRLLRALDRRYFRVSGNLQQTLPELTSEIAAARDVRMVATLVERHIIDVLSVESVALLLSAPDGTFRSPRGTARPVPAGWALEPLLADASGVVDLTAERRGSWFHLLPAAEREWLADGPFSVLVPLLRRDRTLLGMLAVGPRRSDQPFEAEHLNALRTAAATCALVLEEASAAEPAVASHPAESPEGPAGECERCGAVHPAPVSRCPCGGKVDSAAVPHVLAGKFSVSQRVARGGMGVVYRALDTELHRAVAIKTLPRVSAAAVLAMRREARTMASVAHPNLAILYGLESWCGAPMLLVEFLESGTLADRLKTGPLPISDTIALGVKMADAVAYLHAQGLLHRDIKPSNIGFARDGTPKLMDFGLASLVTGADATLAAELGPTAAGVAAAGVTGVVAGTPAYLPPEVLGGAQPAPALDVWSLTLVLYEALTGMNPFSGGSIDEVLARVRTGRIADARRSRPDCPAPLALLLRDGLARDAHARPSARELQQRLVRAAAE